MLVFIYFIFLLTSGDNKRSIVFIRYILNLLEDLKMNKMTIADVNQMLRNKQISYQTARQLVYEIEKENNKKK